MYLYGAIYDVIKGGTSHLHTYGTCVVEWQGRNAPNIYLLLIIIILSFTRKARVAYLSVIHECNTNTLYTKVDNRHQV